MKKITIDDKFIFAETNHELKGKYLFIDYIPVKKVYGFTAATHVFAASLEKNAKVDVREKEIANTTGITPVTGSKYLGKFKIGEITETDKGAYQLKLIKLKADG